MSPSHLAFNKSVKHSYSLLHWEQSSRSTDGRDEVINAGNILPTALASPNGGGKRPENPLEAGKEFICPKENGRKKKQDWGRYRRKAGYQNKRRTPKEEKYRIG